MALPVNRDVVIYRGDPYEHEVTWKVLGVPLDLTEFGDLAVVAQYRPDPDSPDADAVPFAADISAGVDGIFRLSLTAEQTAELPEEGGYDAQVTYHGETTTWLWGRAHCTRDFTRA